MYALLQLPKRSQSLVLLRYPNRYPPSVLKCFYWSKYKFRKHQRRIYYYYYYYYYYSKAKYHWLRQLKSVEPKLALNEHLGLLPTGTPY